jgi:hypothetical protein
MSAILPQVDASRSYIVSGETLNALVTLANQFANLKIQLGEKLDIIYGDNNAVITIPSVPNGYEELYLNVQLCADSGCSSARFLVAVGSEGT